jgi:hypothetical protein
MLQSLERDAIVADCERRILSRLFRAKPVVLFDLYDGITLNS